MIEEIREFVDENVNPSLAEHDGHLAINRLDDDGTLYVTLSGGCQGCASSKITLQQQIGAYLIEEYAEVTGIVDLTDHDSGENPYYRKEAKE